IVQRAVRNDDQPVPAYHRFKGREDVCVKLSKNIIGRATHLPEVGFDILSTIIELLDLEPQGGNASIDLTPGGDVSHHRYLIARRNKSRDAIAGRKILYDCFSRFKRGAQIRKRRAFHSLNLRERGSVSFHAPKKLGDLAFASHDGVPVAVRRLGAALIAVVFGQPGL